MRFERLSWDFSIKTIAEAPVGLDGLVIGEMARLKAGKGILVHVAADAKHSAEVVETVRFFTPDVQVIRFPAWDCLPYDRVSPNPEVMSARMAALARLTYFKPAEAQPVLLATTVNAALQRLPPRDVIRKETFIAKVGNEIDLDKLVGFLERTGYSRTGTVMEPGEFAVRGGILDIYPPGRSRPVRLDFFGDTLESVRAFESESQRSVATLKALNLFPMSEVRLDEASIHRFRQGYVTRFGAVTDTDPLYEAVSAARKHAGMEHWLPLFHEKLETIFDYCANPVVVIDPQAERQAEHRFTQIEDHFRAREEARRTSAGNKFGAAPYKPLPPELLYLDADEWAGHLTRVPTRVLSPYTVPEAAGVYAVGGRQARSFAQERQDPKVNLFDAVVGHVRGLKVSGKRVMIACATEGSAERMIMVLKDHGLTEAHTVEGYAEALKLDKAKIAVIKLRLEQGFETDDMAVISEADILGDRLVRQKSRAKKAQNFLKEVASLTPQDLVVHVDHGIGRYEGLRTIEVQGHPHDCLEIIYAGGDKLFLPVENIELLTRFGSDDEGVQLDKLGGGGWQARKSKLKQRIREMAAELIRIAAERELKSATRITPAPGVYEEFCARFPYEETDDQLNAIADVIEDLARGRPMDRLICGDVGFGKTEVALRAAFLAALTGVQVAVVVPTTLLARQHFASFSRRFAGLPVRIAQLSRFVAPKHAAKVREDLRSGQIDIVVGTHALLAKTIAFRNLGLLIVDEEQHFGVAHKERLKQLRSDVHVLTLTATPIPRTLQLALSGVRQLSIIATPPVDRLAVRTFVSPFDPVVIREALLREKFRGGQSFYVCPRIADLAGAGEFLKEVVPEVRFVIAHGQMAAGELEDVMSAFYDGKFDVLVSTTIVESGLDIPTANTLVVHRADMFGLSQLYQIRGRIGRSKERAYAYFTFPDGQKLTGAAEKRLKVLQTLDTLGAGFTLATHDLDIRGAGNLLGDEQSGHIREVGIELYQDMLEEAVSSLKTGGVGGVDDGQWSPQLALGLAVLIPETYVADLDVRMGLYRRLSELGDRTEIEAFAAELHDRFGALPEEVEHLLKIVEIKALCRRGNVDRVDAGPKGITIGFRNNTFHNPAGLVVLINAEGDRIKLRPDHRLVYRRSLEDPAVRMKVVERFLDRLAKIAEASTPAEVHKIIAA